MSKDGDLYAKPKRAHATLDHYAGHLVNPEPVLNRPIPKTKTETSNPPVETS